jgi:nucleotide-binding universal stress UspA family protein
VGASAGKDIGRDLALFAYLLLFDLGQSTATEHCVASELKSKLINGGFVMYKNILVPVVFDEGHDAKASFTAARALADKDAKFTVLHVMENIPNYVALEIPQEVLDKSKREVENALAKSVKGLEGAEAVMVQGTAGRAIVDYAKANDIDCIVIASHQLGLADIFIGSTASKVVRNANCSVHVIR